MVGKIWHSSWRHRSAARALFYGWVTASTVIYGASLQNLRMEVVPWFLVLGSPLLAVYSAGMGHLAETWAALRTASQAARRCTAVPVARPMR